MKPYLRPFTPPSELQDLPDGTYYDAGFLVTKNAGWRSVRPVIDEDACIGCLQCYLHCPDGVIARDGGKLTIDYDFCKGCGICRAICKPAAIRMEAE